MKKIKTLVALALSATMLVGAAACDNENESFMDYYTFDTSAITSELLYGSEMKIDPVVKNLGSVVDANYNVSVSLDGKDVTSSVYDKSTKIFAPAKQADAIGTYTFNLTIVDAEGNNVLDENGKTFSTSFNVDYCMMNFVPKENAGAGVTVNNDNPLSPVITFDETYASGAATAKTDSGQYRVTGVSFADNYEIVYRVKANAISENEETRFFFGVDRTDENKRDDNIALNVNDGRLSAWFFQDSGQAGGDDWTGTGWVNTTKSVEKNLTDGTEHLIGFTRVVSTTGNAYYVITWDGDYFTTLNIKGNYTDTVGGVWVESINVEGSIEVASFRNLAKDTAAPAVVLNYEDVGVGSTIDLNEGLIVMDEIYNATSGVAWEVTDPAGEAVAVTGGKATLAKDGEYTVKATVADLSGNRSETSTKFTVYSDFNISNLGLKNFYKAESQITANVAFATDDEAMIGATSAILYKGTNEVENAITGDAKTGYKFTPASAGKYTLRVSTVSMGRPIQKDFEFTVSGKNATDIDMSRNTEAARTGVSMMIYGEGALSVYSGNLFATATDVTSEVVKTHTTTTCETNKTYTYFTPTKAGTYYIAARQGEGDTITLRATKVTVKDDTIWVYDDEKLDVGNGNLDKVVYGNNEMIFLDNGATNYQTSKVVYDNMADKGYQGNMTIEFKMTDLKFHGRNKKLFITLGTTGADGWKWNDICLEGSPNNDLWGYCTNIFGFGWVEYQWRSVWQDPVTTEFIPDNDPDYEGEGYQYAFRQGNEYGTLYAAGTHTYRIEIRETGEEKCAVYFYIDGRPEATHRNLTYKSNQLGCVVINSDTMSGVMSDIKIINED